MNKESIILAMIAEGCALTKDVLSKLINSPSSQWSQPEEGAVWISCVDGWYGLPHGTVFSAYYHPTKRHTATTEGSLG